MSMENNNTIETAFQEIQVEVLTMEDHHGMKYILDRFEKSYILELHIWLKDSR